MDTINLTAVAIENEINLNRISEHFGIDRKIQWDEPLVLMEQHLKGIAKENANKRVYVFAFGTVVFTNHGHHEMVDMVNYLKRVDKGLKPLLPFAYTENYRVEIDPGSAPSINYAYMSVPAVKDRTMEILCTVLAKSVGLEKIEAETAELLDEIESIVQLLEKGHFNIRDEKLAKMSAKILGFKYSTLSYIMLLDKPASTWDDEDLERTFTRLSEVFELRDRFDKIRIKTETLLDITEVFTSLAHAKRGTRLELIVIVLIAFEIILSLVERFLH